MVGGAVGVRRNSFARSHSAPWGQHTPSSVQPQQQNKQDRKAARAGSVSSGRRRACRSRPLIAQQNKDVVIHHSVRGGGTAFRAPRTPRKPQARAPRAAAGRGVGRFSSAVVCVVCVPAAVGRAGAVLGVWRARRAKAIAGDRGASPGQGGGGVQRCAVLRMQAPGGRAPAGAARPRLAREARAGQCAARGRAGKKNPGPGGPRAASQQARARLCARGGVHVWIYNGAGGERRGRRGPGSKCQRRPAGVTSWEARGALAGCARGGAPAPASAPAPPPLE